MSAIDVRGLGFVYVHAARPAVRVVSFAVATGEILLSQAGGARARARRRTDMARTSSCGHPQDADVSAFHDVRAG